MIRIARFCMVLLAAAGAAGCSGKQARRDDAGGGEPKVALSARLPAGRYAGIADMSGSVAVDLRGQRDQTVNTAVRMEIAMDVAESGQRKTGCLSFTRVKTSNMGYEADTDIPLPAEPKKPTGPWGDVALPSPFPHDPSDPRKVLRQAIGELIGPKIECELLPDGQVGTVLRNELVMAIKNPQMAKAMGENMAPKDLVEGFGWCYCQAPVGVGAIWHVTRERRVPGMAGRIPVETECELTALQDTPAGKIATVKYYSNICRDLNATSDGVTTRNVDVTFRGLGHIDVNTGLQLDNAGTMTGELRVQTQGRSGKVTVNIKMNFSAKPEP